MLKEAQEHDKDGKCAREIQQQMMKAYNAMNPMTAGGSNDEVSQEEALKRAAQDPEVQVSLLLIPDL